MDEIKELNKFITEARYILSKISCDCELYYELLDDIERYELQIEVIISGLN